MADNLTLNAGSGGSALATKEVAHGGDTTQLQTVSLVGCSGAEGSYTIADINGDATYGLDVDLTRLPAANVGAQAMAVSLCTTLATDDTHLGAVGAAADVDGVVHGQLRYLGEATAAVQTAAEVMDDWDESDRAKVNLVAGQAGISAGAGAVAANTPRMTLASDDPAVALLTAIDGYLDTEVAALVTAVQIIDNIVSGSEAQVDIVAALPAGDNNIGNVDLVSLPAGNLGQQAAAASLSVVPGTDIADATYIGDIKFGESLPAGTNAIGKLAANSGVDIGDVDVTSIAAGTNTIGGTIAQPSTSTAYDGTTACTIKRATGLAASGTTSMVGAVADKKIRVLALALFATSATATNVYVHNDDNNILGDASNPVPLANDADGDNISGFVLPWNPGGWAQTDTANEALSLTLSAAQDVIYAITYIEVA